ncbi:hypothetical protein K523DRAFT_156440 [Schizophyllum commune Tattone D]|nr:hypothetical protein K523DRAFT_156440 [Schizophyllum commune Tattone D]
MKSGYIHQMDSLPSPMLPASSPFANHTKLRIICAPPVCIPSSAFSLSPYLHLLPPSIVNGASTPNRFVRSRAWASAQPVPSSDARPLAWLACSNDA